MLHTINKSPFENNSLANCMRFLSETDVVLLLEDGVYAAAASTVKSSLVTDVLKTNKVYALQADIKGRSITDLIEGVEVVDYDTFVDLVEAHQMQAWL